MKRKINQKDIENAACDGKYILGIHKPKKIDKRLITAYAEMPATADILSACSAINAARQRVRYALDTDIILIPCPVNTASASDNYREIAEIIIKDINRDFFIECFEAYENNSRVNFSFDLIIPQSFEKNNAELLTELKNQFGKLSNNICVSATIIRKNQQKSH